MIIGHQKLLDEVSTRIIFSFHMPFFFCISGMFWKKTPFKLAISKTFKQLIMPFLIIAVSWCLYYLICYIINGIPLKLMVPYVLCSCISPGKSIFSMTPYCEYLWFLLALSIIKCFASSCTKHTLYLLVIPLTIIGIYFSINDITLLFGLDSALLALPFYTIGIIMSSYFKQSFALLIEIFICLFSFCVVLIGGYNNGRVDINNCLYGNNFLMYLLVGIAGTLMIVSLSKILVYILSPNMKLLLRITSLSAGLLLVVGYSSKLTSCYRDIILIFYPDVDTSANLFGLLLGALVLITFYPITLGVKKYMPIVIGYRK